MIYLVSLFNTTYSIYLSPTTSSNFRLKTLRLSRQFREQAVNLMKILQILDNTIYFAFIVIYRHCCNVCVFRVEQKMGLCTLYTLKQNSLIGSVYVHYIP